MTKTVTVTDIFKLPVHPAADAFPMLPEDELDEPAEDIKVNGLKHALVAQEIDGVLTLIDGRNRRVACKRAEVAPTATPFDGKDPVAYIILTNITRRHLTKGQQAMTIAMIYPEPEQAHPGKKSEAEKRVSGSGHHSRARVQEARTVLRHTPDNAELVRVGTMTLSTAYERLLASKSPPKARRVSCESCAPGARSRRPSGRRYAELARGSRSPRSAEGTREHPPLQHIEGTQLMDESRLFV